MPALSIAVDAAMAGLMVALIVYCVKLNRRLAAIRDSDAEIRQMIVELRNAADRADAATNVLKSVGLEAERSLRVQVLRAEAVRDGLGTALNGRAVAAARTAERAPAVPVRPAANPFGEDDVYAPASPAAAPRTRRDAEDEVLRAIRIARAEG